MSKIPDYASQCVAWLHKHYIFIVTIFVLLVYGMTYSAMPFGNPIRSDGAGYYAYLPSFILYGDPSFERDAEVRYGGEFPRWTYVREYPPTGRYLNALNIGVSLMILPFFLVGHALTIWFGFPWEGGHEFLQMRFAPDGYSFFYQHAAGLAGVFWFLVGFAMLKRILDRRFPRGAVLLAMTGTLLGTNLLYYGSIFTVNAHSFTFALTVFLIALTFRWYERPGHWPVSVGLGGVAALLFLVRPLNVLILLWPVVYGMASWRDVPERIRMGLAHYRSILLMAFTAFLLLIPQLLIWKYSSGHFIVRAYQHMDGSDFGMPDLWEVFVGVQNGMLLWFPVFLFAYLGLWRMWLTRRDIFLPVLILLISYPFVIGSYQGWLTAGGFGNRYLVDMTPFAVFPIAACYAGIRTLRAKWLVGMVTVLFIVWPLFLLTLHLRRETHILGLDSQALFDIFWWRKNALMDWWATR